MKIGHYVSVVAGQKGFENNVSGHIQVPMHAMKLLQDDDHECHLITNSFGEDRSLPTCLPSGVQVHFVADARKRGGVLERTASEGDGVNPSLLIKQVQEIKAICKEQQLDVLHLYGYNRTAHLAGGLKMFGLDIPVVVTMFATFFPEPLSWVTNRFWKRIDGVVTATNYTATSLSQAGIRATEIKHGVMRELLSEIKDVGKCTKTKVLFWRDLTVENGADVTLDAYISLAPKYPDVEFELAVRKHWNEIEGVEERIAPFENIHLRRFPYRDGVSLASLIDASICVVLPIRDISIDPQLVIVETLAAGVPIVTTDHRSNPELVRNGETGFLVPLGGIEETIDSIETLLSDRQRAAEMGKLAKEDIAARWNWNQYLSEILDVYKKVTHS